jgi:hypothetical protein
MNLTGCKTYIGELLFQLSYRSAVLKYAKKKKKKKPLKMYGLLGYGVDNSSEKEVHI